ncbi:MAG: hypothetical protein JNG90_05930, partial [Planctomycetaceae bacterium]|nr:hypothetical protein [Planctomycetaceae bacterium]
MLAPLPLERLRRELLRRGLPPSYVERVVGEWADHYEDLSSAHFSKEADMPATKVIESFGSETELAEAAVLQFRARTFAGRHPVWTFIVAPVPLLILCWVAYYSSMALVLSTARDSLFDRTSPAAHALVQLCFETSLLLPPVAAALVLARMARRSGRRARWLLAACALVALIAGCHRANLALPIGGGDGSLMVGFGIGSRQIVWQQAAFPLLIGGAVAWWMSRKPTG